jgi:nucleoid-associated protein YgaU
LAAPAFQIAQAAPTAPAAASPPAATPPSTAAAKPKIAAKAKPTSAKKVPSVINVENKRTVTLKSLQISLPGGQGKVVGKLAKEIAGGKSARVALKGAKGCEYDVKWVFEDATDESTADLCNDPRIVLTD